MNIWGKLNKLLARRDEFDEASQDILGQISSSVKNLESISEMKKTEGWQILEEHIRVNVHARIRAKVKDDDHINALLNILSISDSKTALEKLDEEIDKMLQE